MARGKKWLTPSIAIALLGVIVGAIPEVTPYFEQSEVCYSTNEVTGYPAPYDDNKPAPGDIRSEVLARGLVRTLTVEVWNEGQTGADVTVRIPISKDDKLLSGWMSDSATPGEVYLLQPEKRFPQLIRGERVAFYLNLGNVKSDVASRIAVFDGHGRLATYYKYSAVRYVGDNVAFTLPIRRSWVYIVLGLVAIGGLLLAVLLIVKRKLTAISANKCVPAESAEDLRNSSPGSTMQGHNRRDRPPGEGAKGGA